MKKKIMVAMSGGVDSSVAALLSKEAGHEVVGVTMCFSAQESRKKRPSCCGLEGIEDARRVAQQIGIPHYVLSFGAALRKSVITDFIREYTHGRTPNPCVRCNQYLKFDALLKKAKAMGLGYLATGHYARIGKRGGSFYLKKGVDSKKDQSYFLCQVDPAHLSRLLFPLGEMTKDEVRAVAKERGLSIADKPGSQEVCFIPEDDYRVFLKERMNTSFFRPGDILDTTGRVLGQHQGIFNYTIGQREGLGISSDKRLYVIRLDIRKNDVIVGPREYVFSDGLVAEEPNIFVPSAFKKIASVEAKIRYNHSQVSAKARLKGDRLEVAFSSPVPAVTPGQFVVLYKGDVVLAGAKITQGSSHA